MGNFDFGSFGQGAASSFLGFGLNALANKINMKNQRKFFDYTQDRTNDMQLNNLLKQPALQKQGLINAGINPATMNGDFSAPMNAPQGSSSNAMMDAPQNDIATFMQLKQQKELNDANISYMNAQRDNQEADAALKRLQANNLEMYNQSLSKYVNDYGFAPEHAHILSQIGLLDSQKKGVDIENYFKPAQMQQTMVLIAEQIGLTKTQRKQLETAMHLDTLRTSAEIKLMAANAFKAYCDGNLARASIMKVKAETTQLDIVNKDLEARLNADKSLTIAQKNQYVQGLYETQARVAVLYAQGKYTEAQTVRAEFETKFRKEHAEFDRYWSMGKDIIDAGCRIGAAIGTAGLSEVPRSFSNMNASNPFNGYQYNTNSGFGY